LVTGRAILLSIPWQNDCTLHLLNVYAPNDPTENQRFWSQLLEHWTTNHSPPPKADIMLGDFNLVEDKLDRLPLHADHAGAVAELNALKTCLGLYNGWHTTYRNKREFSFLQGSTGSQSCIDHIYASYTLLQIASQWNIICTGLLTDHSMVSTHLVNRTTPFIGSGRWTMPLLLMHDEEIAPYI
ncbi:uncharacterized protein PHACADRAFT_103486, partial [Phanerochaete carnosa HHB-10118-sp]